MKRENMKEVTLKKKVTLDSCLHLSNVSTDPEFNGQIEEVSPVILRRNAPIDWLLSHERKPQERIHSTKHNYVSRSRKSPVKLMEKHRESERFRHQGLNATIEYLANRVPGYNIFTFSKTKVVKMQLLINYICHLENYISNICENLNLNSFSKQCFLSSQLLQGELLNFFVVFLKIVKASLYKKITAKSKKFQRLKSGHQDVELMNLILNKHLSVAKTSPAKIPNRTLLLTVGTDNSLLEKKSTEEMSTHQSCTPKEITRFLSFPHEMDVLEQCDDSKKSHSNETYIGAFSDMADIIFSDSMQSQFTSVISTDD